MRRGVQDRGGDLRVGGVDAERLVEVVGLEVEVAAQPDPLTILGPQVSGATSTRGRYAGTSVASTP